VCEDDPTDGSSSALDGKRGLSTSTTLATQVARIDNDGRRIDAHDGEIRDFGGVYYLYGTNYECGFAWRTPGTPFCGFASYASPDLLHWSDNGPLFDATTPTWQQRCDGSTYGCFRPHVVFNRTTSQYVLWINGYDARLDTMSFRAQPPRDRSREVALPTLAVNGAAPTVGVNNGTRIYSWTMTGRATSRTRTGGAAGTSSSRTGPRFVVGYWPFHQAGSVAHRST